MPATSNAGFCVLVQLTDEVVNRTVEVAYDSGLIRKEWKDSRLVDWPDYGIALEIEYELELGRPKVHFDSGIEDAIAVEVGLRGQVNLEAQVADPEKASERRIESARIDLELSVTCVASARLAPTKKKKQAVFLDLADLRDLNVEFGDVALSSDVSAVLRSVLLGIVRKRIKEQEKIPLSVDFESARRARRGRC